MGAWRSAGLTYIDYSTIAARLLRQVLKADFRAEAARRGESHIKLTPWVDGKPVEGDETSEPKSSKRPKL